MRLIQGLLFCRHIRLSQDCFLLQATLQGLRVDYWGYLMCDRTKRAHNMGLAKIAASVRQQPFLLSTYLRADAGFPNLKHATSLTPETLFDGKDIEISNTKYF